VRGKRRGGEAEGQEQSRGAAKSTGAQEERASEGGQEKEVGAWEWASPSSTSLMGGEGWNGGVGVDIAAVSIGKEMRRFTSNTSRLFKPLPYPLSVRFAIAGSSRPILYVDDPA